MPRSLLIVEDNTDAAQMLCEVLQPQGHRVAVAETGQQGLELLRRDAFDVVLCDIGLPGMSGYQFALTIRSDSSLGAPALITITGYGQPEDRKRTAAAGFDAHLVKPVTLELLERVLKVPLESNHP